jgi:LuxR family transcriptional regulator, maltose regulon positive regulatory protein
MPKAVSTLSWSAAEETYILSEPQSADARALVPDRPAWFAWLAEQSSFAFHGQAGSYTARLEAVQRGERYWYAYLRTGQKLRKKYLGKTDDLTFARLEQVARLLHADRARDDPRGTALVGAKAPHQPPPTPEAIITPAQRTTVGPAAVAQRSPVVQVAVPGDPLTPLLSTRLHVPRSPARLVPRAHLIERLRQGLSQSLILVCAPAGFGKTTLLTEFVDESGLPAAWLSLEEEDNDPRRFLSLLLASFQTIDPTLGAGLHALLSSPQGLQGFSLSAVFTLLINDLAIRDTGELLLVLDDYHAITLEEIQHALASLVEHGPPNLHLVISTRADPRLPLARLRARGQLCELRATELQFDAAEASSFLHTALQRDLEESTIATILSRTEGWITGLQLTALLLQGQRSEAEVRQLLTDALGSHRYLVDYLVEEVLARQPEAVQSFLLHTSILECLSAPLCAAVTRESAGESEAMLTTLEKANLFLVPLDERREWYRYHQLWASVLHMLLLRRLGTPGVAALYAQASRWYEQHDMPGDAIESALKAEEFERVAQLLEQLGPLLLARNQYYTLRRWIERLPHQLRVTRPIISLSYAWTLFFSGAHDAYAAPLQEAEQIFRREANSVGVGMVEALRALAALMWGDGKAALASGREALTLVPEGEQLLRSVITSVVGGGHWLVGEVEAAWQQLQEARALHERIGNVSGLLVNTSLLGQVLATQGKLHEAADLYQHVIDTAAEHHENAIEATIRQALLWYEWNAFEVAEARLAHAIAEAPALANRTLLGRGVLSLAYVTQARMRQARGEQDAASSLFAQAVALAHQQRHARLLALAQAAQVRWWLAQGQMEAVMRWREGWASTHDTTPSYEDETGALTLARVLIAGGEPEQALRLLDGFRTLARTQERLGSELEILVLCALAEDVHGQTGQAVQHLEQALTLAEPQGYVRLFVDEGVPMLTLLRQVLSSWEGRRSADYVRRLLSVLEAKHPQQAKQLPGLQVPLRQRDLDAHPHNLPIQRTRLIGRKQEISEVCRQLRHPEVCLLTLTGPGGVGKTRLALQVAAELSDLFPDGIVFVALAPLTDPQWVVPTIAQTLAIGEKSFQPSLTTLMAAIKEKQLLLLLDNLEHVAAAASDLAELLTACPKLKLLVTSRVGLHLRAEREFAVSPLAVPPLKEGLPNLATLLQYEAVTLFIERAQAVKPDFQITNANAAAVGEICARLDGLPLAIELAAARSKTFPPQALLDRLRQGLSVLTTQVRDLPARQQTLQSTIAWSYNLLPVEEQQLFRRLAVFIDGCTCQAAEQVCTAASELEGDMLEMLASLVDKSLLQQVEQADGEVRFQMLQTLREYGLERLAAEEESETNHRAHAGYYLALAREAEAGLTGLQQAMWLERLEQEHENLRAAIQWLLERAEGAQARNDEAEMVLRLVGVLWRFWSVRAYLSEGRSFLERAMAVSKGASAALRAKALTGASWLAFSQNAQDEAEAFCRESLALYRQLGQKEGMAFAFQQLAVMAHAKNEYARARSLLEEALTLFKEIENQEGIASTLDELAYGAMDQGEYSRARQLAEQALTIFRKIGDKRLIIYALLRLGRVLFFPAASLLRHTG